MAAGAAAAVPNPWTSKHQDMPVGKKSVPGNENSGSESSDEEEEEEEQAATKVI